MSGTILEKQNASLGQGGGEAQRGRSPGHVLTSLLRGRQWAPGEDAVHWASPT